MGPAGDKAAVGPPARDPVRESRWAAVCLAAILFVAIVLRFWGIDFGYPGKFRPDEEFVVESALRFHSGDLNPHFFDYPTGYLYLLSLVLLAVRTLADALWLGAGGFDRFVALEHAAPPYLIGRALTALCGVLGVYAVYQLGRRAFGQRTGLIAAALLAVNFSHVRESHFATTDVPMTLLTTLAVSASMSLAARGRTRDYLLTGSLFGLAAATKYTAVALAVAFPLAHFFRARPQPVSRALGWGRFLLGASAGLGLFLLVSPYLWLDLATSRQAFALTPPFLKTQQIEGFPLGANGVRPGLPWLMAFGLRYGAGIALELAMGLAITWVGWRLLRDGSRGLAPWALLASPIVVVAVFIVVCPWAFLRYVLPMLPMGVVLAAAFLEPALTRLLRRPVLAGALLVAVLGAEPAWRSLGLLRLLSTPDTRQLARGWIALCVPAGAEIATSGLSYARPELPHGFRYVDILRVDVQRVQWVLANQPPVALFAVPWPESVSQVVRGRGKLVASFDPFVAGRGGEALYDPQDAFFVPIGGFAAVRRPGPALQVFRMGDPLIGHVHPWCTAAAGRAAVEGGDPVVSE